MKKNSCAPLDLSVRILSDPRYLHFIRELTSEICESLGFFSKEVNRVCLALDEACANIIKYAYEGKNDQSIDIRYQSDEQVLCVTIQDYGKKCNPDEIQGRDLSDIRPGGLGVHLIRTVMDKITFDSSPEKGTILKMMIKIPSSS